MISWQSKVRVKIESHALHSYKYGAGIIHIQLYMKRKTTLLVLQLCFHRLHNFHY